MEITPDLVAEIERMILVQIKAHMSDCPLEDTVRELKAEKEKVRDLLALIQKKLNGLWANGSGGPPGYLEKQEEIVEGRFARLEKQNAEQFQRLFDTVSDLKKDKYRAEGAAEQAEKDETKAGKKSEVKRDWLKIALTVAGIGGGAWLLDFIKSLIAAHGH